MVLFCAFGSETRDIRFQPRKNLYNEEVYMVTIRKKSGRILGLVLAIAILIATAEGFTVKTFAAETKTST